MKIKEIHYKTPLTLDMLPHGECFSLYDDASRSRPMIYMKVNCSPTTLANDILDVVAKEHKLNVTDIRKKIPYTDLSAVMPNAMEMESGKLVCIPGQTNIRKYKADISLAEE